MNGRVNDQYRVTFRWDGHYAEEVRVEDYHA
jgi:plasmid maintenance system killer protein